MSAPHSPHAGDLGLFSFVDVDPSLSVHALRAKLAADAAAVAAQLLLSCGGRPLVGSVAWNVRMLWSVVGEVGC